MKNTFNVLFFLVLGFSVQAQVTASFSIENGNVCAGDSLNYFMDESYTTNGSIVSWEWSEDSPQGQTSTFQNTNFLWNAPGSYTVCLTVTDDLGFQDDTCVLVDVYPLPVADAGADVTITCNNSVFLLDGSGSSTGAEYTYTWYAQGVVIGTSVTLEVTTPGFYYLNVTNTTTGCSSWDAAEVIDDTNIPIIQFPPPPVLNCDNAEVELGYALPGTFYTYNWTTPDGNILGDPSQAVITVDQPGTYILQVVNDNNGCAAVYEVQVTGNAADEPIIEAVVTNVSCFGEADGAIEVTVSCGEAPFAFTWSNGTTTQNITGLTAGNYSLTVTDATGNSAVENFVVSEPAPLNVDIVFGGSPCTPDSMFLFAQSSGGCSPYLFLWNNGNSNSTIPINAPGEYCVTITDACGCSSVSDCFTADPGIDCVWPGDTDTNKVVNHFDLLYIGLANGATGPQRPNASIQWFPQYSPEWNQYIVPPATNYKHIDTDGNGFINSFDTLAIVLNWGNVHGLWDPKEDVALTESENGLLDAPPFYVEPDTITGGETLSLDLILGEAGATIDNLYGLAFSIQYDTSVVEPGSVLIHFENSWLGTIQSDMISIQKDFSEAGRIDVAITRIDGVEVNGEGVLGSLQIIVQDDVLLWNETKGTESGIVKEVAFTISNARLIDNENNEIEVETLTTFAPVESLNTGISDPTLEANLFVFPNPTSEFIHLLSNGAPFESVMLYNLQGELLQVLETEGTALRLQVSDFQSGLYFLKISTKKGTVIRKVAIK